MAGSSAAVPESDLLRQLTSEFSQRFDRQRNIIVFGVDEHQATTGTAGKQADKDFVARVFEHLGVASDIIKIFRVGKKSPSTRNRPIKVVLRSVDDARALIKRAKKLQENGNFRHVFLSLDRTPQQQEDYRALKEQLRVRIDAGERDLKLVYVSGSPRIVKWKKPLNALGPADRN